MSYKIDFKDRPWSCHLSSGLHVLSVSHGDSPFLFPCTDHLFQPQFTFLNKQIWHFKMDYNIQETKKKHCNKGKVCCIDISIFVLFYLKNNDDIRLYYFLVWNDTHCSPVLKDRWFHCTHGRFLGSMEILYGREADSIFSH